MRFWRRLLGTYLSPGNVAGEMKTAMPREETLLAYVMFAALISFLARLPGLIRAGEETGNLAGFIAASFVAALIFGPLFLYAVAALSRLIARLLGGSGSGAGARAALFWPLFALQPLVIVNVIIERGAFPATLQMISSLAMTGFFIYTWMRFLLVMERSEMCAGQKGRNRKT